jgi:hypothetical protein
MIDDHYGRSTTMNANADSTGHSHRRKPRSETRQRTAVVALRLLPAERDVLAAAARARNISLSEYIRASAMKAVRA